MRLGTRADASNHLLMLAALAQSLGMYATSNGMRGCMAQPATNKTGKRKTLFMRVYYTNKVLWSSEENLDLDGFFHCLTKCLGSGCLGTGEFE